MRVDDRPEAIDIAVRNQPFQPELAGRLGEADGAREIGDRDASVIRDNLEDFQVDLVKITKKASSLGFMRKIPKYLEKLANMIAFFGRRDQVASCYQQDLSRGESVVGRDGLARLAEP